MGINIMNIPFLFDTVFLLFGMTFFLIGCVVSVKALVSWNTGINVELEIVNVTARLSGHNNPSYVYSYELKIISGPYKSITYETGGRSFRMYRIGDKTLGRYNPKDGTIITGKIRDFDFIFGLLFASGGFGVAYSTFN